MVVLPPLIAAILSLCIFVTKGMELDRLSATALIGVYFCYSYYSMIISAGDFD